MMRKKLSLALAGAGLLTLALPGAVQAGALATSVLQMSGFSIEKSPGVAFDITTDFALIVPSSSASIDATYNGAGTSSAGGPSPTGQIDLLPVCSGPGCPGVANNVFPYLTNPPAGQFVAADQNEGGTPVAGQVFPVGHPDAGKPIPVGAIVESGSWAILTGNAPGPNAAGANNQLSTTFIFTVAAAGTMTFKFDAKHYQESFLSADLNFPSSAQTSSQFFFKITSVGVTIFDFTPDGIAGNATGASGEVDPFSLNASTSRIAPFNQITGTTRILSCATPGVACAGSFSATTAILTPGVEYELNATLKTTAAAVVLIPEPGVLGLLGLGLLGLGTTLRRKTA